MVKVPYENMLKFNKKMTGKQQMYNKLNMVMSLRAVRPSVILHIQLEKIKLMKEMFVLELEQGLEVFIPPELSQFKLPFSFRYYDSLFNIVQSHMCSHKQDLQAFKNAYRIGFYQNEDISTKILKFIGVKNEGKSKLTFRHMLVNE